MHAGQAPLRYAPVSVGALMDPVFLRDAVHDAAGEPRDALGTRYPPSRWRVTLRRLIERLAHR